jgi:two-component system OmpR family response regulator
MLSLLLGLSFIEVRAVGTAAEALLLIQSENFDLFMLDAWLPEVDGFELCRRMRAAEPQIPILFFSGAAYESDKKKGFEAGAAAYVTKPDIYEMVESVKQLTAHFADRPATAEIRPPVEVLVVSPRAAMRSKARAAG